MKAPILDKFLAYGGPGEGLSSQLDCRIVGIKGANDLYVTPHANFDYMCIEGNRRYPTAAEAGISEYRDYVLGGGGAAPVLKCETYEVGGRGAGDGGAQTKPQVWDSGVQREVRVGDSIRLTGLYVIDYPHSMYSTVHSPSFSYLRAPTPSSIAFRIGFAHAELHPYDWGAIQLLSSLTAGQRNTQTHTAVAPMAPEVYSYSYGYNKVMGVACHFVPDKVQNVRAIRFTLRPTDRPGANYRPFVEVSDTRVYGVGRLVETRITPGSEDVQVEVIVEGSLLTSPFVHQACYEAVWRRAAPDELAVPPDPSQSTWRWCSKCQGLFFGGGVGSSVCPSGGTHASPSQSRSGNYVLLYNARQAPGRQNGWRWCSKCQGLFFGPMVSSSVCPSGTTHAPLQESGSGNYTLLHTRAGQAGWQSGWRWCSRCQGLYYGPNVASSTCPASGTHATRAQSGSGNYTLRYVYNATI